MYWLDHVGHRFLSEYYYGMDRYLATRALLTYCFNNSLSNKLNMEKDKLRRIIEELKEFFKVEALLLKEPRTEAQIEAHLKRLREYLEDPRKLEELRRAEKFEKWLSLLGLGGVLATLGVTFPELMFTLPYAGIYVTGLRKKPEEAVRRAVKFYEERLKELRETPFEEKEFPKVLEEVKKHGIEGAAKKIGLKPETLARKIILSRERYGIPPDFYELFERISPRLEELFSEAVALV